jgi:hypothetical protein
VTQLGLNPGIPRDVLGYLAPTAPANPNTFYRTNLPRVGLDDLAAALADAVMTSVPVLLAAGDVVTNLSFLSGATALGTPTNWWFALYSDAATPALIAQTADQTTGAWAANTWQTKALSAAYTVPRTGVYWAAVMVNHTAGAVPSLVGTLAARPVVSGERNLAQSSGSALTTTAPATIATPAVQNACPLVVIT